MGESGKLPAVSIKVDCDFRNLEISPVTRYGHDGVNA